MAVCDTVTGAWRNWKASRDRCLGAGNSLRPLRSSWSLTHSHQGVDLILQGEDIPDAYEVSDGITVKTVKDPIAMGFHCPTLGSDWGLFALPWGRPWDWHRGMEGWPLLGLPQGTSRWAAGDAAGQKGRRHTERSQR